MRASGPDLTAYGWTDVVVSEPIKLVPGARKQNTLCIAETFPVKETGDEILRQVCRESFALSRATEFQPGESLTSHKGKEDGVMLGWPTIGRLAKLH